MKWRALKTNQRCPKETHPAGTMILDFKLSKAMRKQELTGQASQSAGLHYGSSSELAVQEAPFPQSVKGASEGSRWCLWCHHCFVPRSVPTSLRQYKQQNLFSACQTLQHLLPCLIGNVNLRLKKTLIGSVQHHPVRHLGANIEVQALKSRSKVLQP